jgi:hypothetical protein
VEALVRRLTDRERDLAIQGLSLLARAAREQMQLQAEAGAARPKYSRVSEG